MVDWGAIFGWGGIVEANYLAKEFVFRQEERNCHRHEKLAEAALENFKQWDLVQV